MIYAENLTKKFGEFTAVNEVNLSIPKGEVMLLLGPNGAGKTTTVRMLSSVLRPTSGNASVAGFDIAREARLVRSSVGVLTEQHGLYKRMNAFEYLRFYAQLYDMRKIVYEHRIADLLKTFGLADVEKKRLGEYSKGMRQKLALVRALLHDPPVLLLDEPTSAMDPESARVVRDSILGLRTSERTLILCTHNLAEADELADQIAIIQQGKIILNGSPDEIKSDLLGPAEYEIQFAENLNGKNLDLPEFVEITHQENATIRFRVKKPEIDNPKLLRNLIGGKLDVITLQKVPQSLEEAYLHGINQQGGGHDV